MTTCYRPVYAGIFLSFLLFVSSLSVKAQNSCNGFQKSYGTNTTLEQGIDIARTSSGDLFLAGHRNNDIIITKTTGSGQLLWTKSYGGPSLETVRKISICADGGLLIVGQTRSFSWSSGSILAFKINNSGGIVWSRNYSASTQYGDLGMDIIETSDGGYAISGILNVNGIVADAVVIKLNSAANTVWTQRFDRNDGEDGVGIVQKGDTLVFAADLETTGGEYSLAITKLRLTTGQVLATKRFVPTSRGLFNPYLMRNPSGSGYIVSGHTIDDHSYGNMNHTVLYLNEALDLTRTVLIAASPITNDFYTGIIPQADGSFIGCATSPFNGNAYFYKVNSANILEYAKAINPAQTTQFYRAVGGNNSAYFLGSYYGLTGTSDLFLMQHPLQGAPPSCNEENAFFSIQQPVYNSSVYTWPSVNTITFNNTVITLSTSDVTLTQIDNCKPVTYDFSFTRDICNPNLIHFSAPVTSSNSFSWNFGNGQTNNSSANVSVTYANTGTYNVSLAVQSTNGCWDTITKAINIVPVTDAGLIITSDVSICPGDSVLIKIKDDQPFCINGGALPPLDSFYISPTSPFVVRTTSEKYGPNLVVNGAFENGNTSFTSEFFYNSSFYNSSQQYHVTNCPLCWYTFFSPCLDHTPTGDRMLVAGVGPVAGKKVWSQTVPISANQTYAFKSWFLRLENLSSPTIVTLLLNGAKVKSITLNGAACNWQEFSLVWNSGSSTVAELSLVTEKISTGDGFFALDDISFARYDLIRDSMQISISGGCDFIDLNGTDTVCINGSFPFTVTKPANCTLPVSYIFSPGVQLVSQNATGAQFQFTQNGLQWIKARLNGGCGIIEDSVSVLVKFSPTTIGLGSDMVRCTDTSFVLNAGTGFETYTWQDGSTGVTYPVSNPGLFHVQAINLCGSVYRDSLVYTQRAQLPLSVTAALPTCEGDSLTLTGTGGTSYQWTPSSLVYTQSDSTAGMIIRSGFQYSVLITDNICSRDTLIQIPVQIEPTPTVTLTKSNDLSCSIDTSVLTATGAAVYTWGPQSQIVSQTLNGAIVKANQNTTFYVIGMNAAGCIDRDSILITVVNTGTKQLFVPNAFTPNGDGKNDKFCPKYFGSPDVYEFRIFNRWGELVFYSKKPGECWDGRWKGQLQPQDVFVFYIKTLDPCGGEYFEKGTFALIR